MNPTTQNGTMATSGHGRGHLQLKLKSARHRANQTDPKIRPHATVESKPTALTPGGELARRRYQKGTVLFSEKRQIWLGRYREDVIRTDGSAVRTRPQVKLGTKKDLPTKRLAMRKLDEVLFRINAPTYQPTRTATIEEFAKRYREEILSKRKPSTVCSANSHFGAHIIPQLGKLRLDQIGPENQQIFINSLQGASRKTALNLLSTLSAMLTTAKNWGYSAQRVELSKLVLPERNEFIAPHFTRSQVEGILNLAQEPWRTFFIVLALSAMRAGEALGLQWADVDFEHRCIHIRRSAWHGRVQSTKSTTSAAPITMPDKLATVLSGFREEWKSNAQGFLFTTRNGRPPSSNKVVEYQLWPILDALGIAHCGLHAFRHSVASFIVDAGYSPEVAQKQLRHTDPRTTQGYIHLRGGITEQAMTAVADSLKLDAVGRKTVKGSQYIQ
jgi:integrase